jgi:hypothetical protein
MIPLPRGRHAAFAAALALMMLLPAESQAQFGIPGGLFNIRPHFGPGGYVGGGYRNGGRRHNSRGDNSGNSSNNTPSSAPATSYALARGASDTVFKGIVVSKGLGAVGVEDAIDTSKHDLVRETQRDYTAAIKALLTMIDNTSKSRNRQGDSSLAQGDVTQHAIDRAVSQAYESASLGTFEQFVGEQWTNERLRVAILDRTTTEVPGLLVGNNFSRVEMAPIQDIIARAGQSIYKRTLETSELIAVNQATARFTRSLFEMHGPSANADLRAGVEELLLAASRVAFKEYEERFVRSDLGVVMRYRAERILVDCLTGNLQEITTSPDNGKATRVQMQDKVSELSRGECRNWVVSAIGAPTQMDAKADKELLKPLPGRAVWIAPGVPKTDASMFSRVSQQ